MSLRRFKSEPGWVSMGVPQRLASAALLVAACGNGEENTGDTPSLTVPPYVNVTVCGGIDEFHSMTGQPGAECKACCANAGYTDSDFPMNSKCVCANLPDTGGDTVCASAAVATCLACCTGAGFFDDRGGGNPTCGCGGKIEDSVCASANTGPQAAGMCAECCLEHGFLNSIGGIDRPNCTCLGR